jgi:hypothetical protein
MTDMIGKPLTDGARRDGNGRYSVVGPDGGKARGYTRATNVAKVIDDMGGLMVWKARVTAVGLAARPDLMATLVAAEPDDKATIDAVCRRAAEAGGQDAKSALGTAIHAMLEQAYTNPDYVAPAEHAADIAAVLQTLREAGARVLPEYVERIVVLDDLKIAGTFDGVLEIGGELFLFDNKTGNTKNLDYGNLAWAIQLAIYSQADAIYTQGLAADGSQDTREPMPQVSRERAVIVHVEPGSARCTLHWLDLTVGAEALGTALDVIRFRKAKALQPFPVALGDLWVESTRQRLQVIVGHPEAKQMVGYLWPTGVPTLKSGDPITPDQREQVDVALAEIEKQHCLPFPTISTTVAPEAPVKELRKPAADEGRTVTQDEITGVNAMAEALPANCQAIVKTTMKACTKANRNIRLSGHGGKPTEHRMEVCKALVALAHFDDVEIILAAIAIATGEQRKNADALGDTLGGLTIQQARDVQGVAEHIAAGRLVPMWNDNATVYLFGNWPPVNR